MSVELRVAADFYPAAAILAYAVDALEPPERIDVHEAALRYRYITNPGGGYTGPWSDEKTPHLIRPMQCLTDPQYRIVVLMGPAQAGKSAMGENWICWCVVVDPATMLWLGADKNILKDYVTQKINPMLRRSDEVRARQLKTQSADNIFSKEFLGDMVVNFIWPVSSNLRMRSAPRWVIDDFDAVPADIDGEGDPIFLLGGRTTAFERTYRGLVMSSPARKNGYCDIEQLVETGTDERPYWRCPHCNEWFSPDFDRDLAFDRTENPEDAAESAHLVCPNNGCIVKYAEKPLLRDSLVYVGAGQTMAKDGTVRGELKRTHIASFRFNGLMGFNSWGLLARECRTAEIEFETRQDESKLRTFYNTKIGVNYVSRLENEGKVTLEDLLGRSEDENLGLVPAGVRFLTAAVDIQGNRFEILVVGWGDNGESWLIDRFALRQLSDGRTDIAPHKVLAHWDALIGRAVGATALGLAYPLAADPNLELPVACTALDSGGLAGVDEHARDFVRKLIYGNRLPDWSLMLIKGANKTTAPALGKPTFEVDDKGKRRRDAIALNVIGVHEIKDTIDVRLRVPEPGPGFVHIPDTLDRRYLEEICGEEKQNGVWVRVGRNETWDLMVYNEAARLRLREQRVDWTNPPAWARPRRRDTTTRREVALPATATVQPAPKQKSRVRILSKGIR